jgi:hypothetical protein
MAKRVYFSFHYQDVIDGRADVVRQHWLSRPDQEAAGFFDASVWENARLSGDSAVKRLLNSSIDRTSATCVLIGSETYSRKWVRYEILKSFRRGSGLLAVHVNHIQGRDQAVKPTGPNPLAHVGVSYSDNGQTAMLWELIGEEWKQYTQIDGSASYQTGGVRSELWGKGFNLAQWYPEYNWVADDGYQNFASWIG